MSRGKARSDFRRFYLIAVCVLFVSGGVAVTWNSRRQARDAADLPSPPGVGQRDAASAQVDETGEPATLDRVEDLSQATDAQLRELGKVLSELPAQVDDRFARLADPTFRCGPLRPSQRAVVFQDTVMTVERQGDGGELAEHTGAPEFRGAEGLRDALRQLAQPFLEGQVNIALKTFSVDVGPGQLTTQAYYQAHAAGPQGALQQNATWQCRWVQVAGAPPRLAGIAILDFEEIRSAKPALFSDQTLPLLGNEPSFQQQLAPGSQYWRRRMQAEFDVDLHGHQGLAIGDVNGDDLDDVYVCQPGGLPNRLYLQTGDGGVREAAAEAGIDWLDRCRSALLLDLDNDGDQDLVVAMNVNVMLMANDGEGHFTEKQSFYTAGDPNSLCASDFDLDGDLDIFVTGYGSGFLAHQDDDAAMGHAIPFPYHDANNGGPNVLLRNDGDWQFSDATGETGLDQNNRRWSFAACWEDYDNDGDPDLYVANDYGRNNLYCNEGGRFVDAAADAGVEDIAAGMSVSWGDYDDDGLIDLYVGNMFSAAGNRIAYQRNFQTAAAASVRQQFQRHARGNTLFKNHGDGTFRDVSLDAGVFMGRWSWGSKFIDFNNDGRLDLFVGNGYLTGDDPNDL